MGDPGSNPVQQGSSKIEPPGITKKFNAAIIEIRTKIINADMVLKLFFRNATTIFI
tara:strand:+ start:513 stop:680 length:168 start_codon:yes stop_codon:yes gene_type:complete